MLKFFVFSAILAFSAAYTVNDFGGEWKAVKIFSNFPVVRECEPMTIANDNSFCKCGSDEHYPKVKMTIGSKFISWPAYYVDSFPAVTESFKTECFCDGKKSGHYVFYHLTDNYFLLMFTDPALEYAVLLAKQVPSETEVTEFVKTIDHFKDKTSYFVCTSETLNANESKVAEGRRWWQYHGYTAAKHL